MKDFLKKIFELNLNSRSYKAAFIRMAISLLVLLLVCIFRFSITITNMVLNLALTVLLLEIMIAAILCFFIAAAECLQVGDNKKKDK